MTLEEWLEHYQPIDNRSGERFGFAVGEQDRLVHTCWGEDRAAVAAADPSTVWTLIDADGIPMIASGLHMVNREGYLITRTTFEGDPLDVYLDEDDREKQEATEILLRDEERRATALNCEHGCQLYPGAERVMAYYDGDRFSHYYCGYCGNTCYDPDED